ncbi:TIGR04222 domain-containing membrane protein [Streptosporangium lutulentum]
MQVVLYVVVIALILIVGSARAALRREHRRVRSAVTHHRGEMTPYELAYLAGGPRRVINTALGMLARAGAIRVSRGGQISLVAGTRGSPDPVEHAILEALRARGGSGPAGELRRTVADGETMSGLRYRLLGMGLIVPDEAFGHAWKLLNRLLILSVLALAVEVGMLVAASPRTASG